MPIMINSYALFRVFEYLAKGEAPSSIRSIARNAGVSVSSAKRCVDYLADRRLVNKAQMGRMYLCQLDLGRFLVRHLKASSSLSRIDRSGLVDELVSRNPAIISIVLFGSVAHGTDTKKSDIDILVVSRSRISFDDLRSEKAVDREISWVQYSPSQWKEKSRTDKVFYDNVLLGGIALYGELPVVR